MSDTNMIQPPKISVSAEASASHRIISPDRNIRQVNAETESRDAEPELKVVANARRMGPSFGATSGVQINKNAEVVDTNLAPQTLKMMDAMFKRLVKFCQKEGALNAVKTAQAGLDLVRRIASGSPIADQKTAPTDKKTS